MTDKRSNFSRVLASLSYGVLKLFRSPQGPRILCYHRVGEDKAQDYLKVSTAQFREQMKFLKSEGYDVISLNDLLAGKAHEKSVVLTFDDGYLDNYENAYPVMKELGFTATIFLIAQKIGEDSFLKLSQIEEMKKAGFEFGSHTLSHPNLKTLSRDEKKRELMDSKVVIEKLLGGSCDHFCYPFGCYDEETVACVKEAGYLTACSNLPGINRMISNSFLLRRTEIAGHDSVKDFEMKMAGAYDFLHQLLHALRGRP